MSFSFTRDWSLKSKINEKCKNVSQSLEFGIERQKRRTAPHKSARALNQQELVEGFFSTLRAPFTILSAVINYIFLDRFLCMKCGFVLLDCMRWMNNKIQFISYLLHSFCSILVNFTLFRSFAYQRKSWHNGTAIWYLHICFIQLQNVKKFHLLFSLSAEYEEFLLIYYVIYSLLFLYRKYYLWRWIKLRGMENFLIS